MARWLEGMNYIFSWQKQYFTKERLFCHSKTNSYFAPPCKILYLHSMLHKSAFRFYGYLYTRNRKISEPADTQAKERKEVERASEVTPGNELGTLGKEGRALTNCADTVYSGHANQDDNL